MHIMKSSRPRVSRMLGLVTMLAVASIACDDGSLPDERVERTSNSLIVPNAVVNVITGSCPPGRLNWNFF
jgi:hypothetical protein